MKIKKLILFPSPQSVTDTLEAIMKKNSSKKITKDDVPFLIISSDDGIVKSIPLSDINIKSLTHGNKEEQTDKPKESKNKNQKDPLHYLTDILIS